MSTKDSWASGSHHRDVYNWVPHAVENLEGRKAVSWFLGRVYAVKTLWRCSYKRDHLQSYGKRTWTNFISLGFQSSPTKQKSNDLFQGAMRIQWDTVHKALSMKPDNTTLNKSSYQPTGHLLSKAQASLVMKKKKRQNRKFQNERNLKDFFVLNSFFPKSRLRL